MQFDTDIMARMNFDIIFPEKGTDSRDFLSPDRNFCGKYGILCFCMLAIIINFDTTLTGSNKILRICG